MVKLKKKHGNPFKGFCEDWFMKIFSGIFMLMIAFVIVFCLIFFIVKALIPFFIIIGILFVAWVIGHFVLPYIY